MDLRGLCLYIENYPPGGGGDISRHYLGKKYDKAKRKRGEMSKKTEERGKKTEEWGKKTEERGKKNEERGRKMTKGK